MTFVLHRAERADALAGRLAEIVAVPPADPFTPEVVAVHSQGVERWLGHQLSIRLGTSPGRTDGVSANLLFPFPGTLVGDALAAATGVDRRTDRWRPERLAWTLLAVVDEVVHEPWMRILACHLGADRDASHDRDRRFAAVRHLADLFDRYAWHRPDMLRAWLEVEGEAAAGADLEPDLSWQARLWRRLRDAVGQPSPAERLAAGCAALIESPEVADLPDRVFLFGITRLPASYLEVLRALAAHRDVHLLALASSPAAWEALAGLTDASDPAGEAAAAGVRHPLLRAWGRDSREMQLVLAGRGLTAHDHHVIAAPPDPATLLGRLQADIRADRAGADPLELDGFDHTLQVHACHGRARQAEVVRDAITHLLAADASLEPRDVVVMCPDIDEMAPLLHAAFGAVDADSPERVRAGQPALPYRLADRSLRQTNPVLAATAELLALVGARLTATQVLAFAGLPAVRERFHLDDDDLERLATWVSGTGIRWGLDGDHRARYDLAGIAAGTWQAGLDRLLLGVAMSEDDLPLVGGALPLDDVDSSDVDLAGRFAELVDRLGHVIAGLLDDRTLAGWTRSLLDAADLLFDAPASDPWQRAQLDHLLADVEGEGGATTTVPIRLAELRDLLADRLRGQPTRAAFRSGDITLCTLVPMRSVPHRVVCVVGLDDGAFPRTGGRDGDDLLAGHRRLGDHDRGTEDRQLLLDALMAAGDALVITYAGRDERTNEVLPPAVPVQELLEAVDRASRSADGRPGRALVLRHHPLNPTDARCFTPGELGLAGAWSFDAVDHAGAGAPPARPPADGPLLPAPLPPLGADLVLLDDLVRFLQHPAKAFLRARLGLSLGTSDDRPADALDVELGGLGRWAVGDRLLAAVLRGSDVEAACAAELARGLLPPGVIGERTLAGIRDEAEAIARVASSLGSGPRTSLHVDLDLPDGRRLLGAVTDVVGDVIRPTSFSRLRAKQRIGAWATHLAATAAHPERPLRTVVVGAGPGAASVACYPALGGTPEGRSGQALHLLAVLLDLYDRGMREALPLFCRTSESYAALRRQGRDEDEALYRAAALWDSGYNKALENREPEHLKVLGGEVPLAGVARTPPAADESGDGWPDDEATRFGRLARRLWDPVLAVTTHRLPRQP